MTAQANFKRRIRRRMEKTGERYAAARQALLTQSDVKDRKWICAPETKNDAVVEATGKSWNEWCDVIEAWPGHVEGHTAIAAYIDATTDIGGWWSQTVTVGFERITGLRLPYQRPDGTFTAGLSRTIGIDGAMLKAMLIDDGARDDLFPTHSTRLVSNPSVKAPRISIGPGIAKFGFDDRGDGRVRVSIQHAKLPQFDLVEEWKFYWSEWLDAIDDAPG